MPPVQHNPFWSMRARGELELRQGRPVDLPVPLDAELDGEEQLVGEERRGRTVRASSREQRQRRSMVADRDEENEGRRVFRTPASWTSQQPLGDEDLGARTSGAMPVEETGESYRGPLPAEHQRAG